MALTPTRLHLGWLHKRGISINDPLDEVSICAEGPPMAEQKLALGVNFAKNTRLTEYLSVSPMAKNPEDPFSAAK